MADVTIAQTPLRAGLAATDMLELETAANAAARTTVGDIADFRGLTEVVQAGGNVDLPDGSEQKTVLVVDLLAGATGAIASGNTATVTAATGQTVGAGQNGTAGAQVFTLDVEMPGGVVFVRAFGDTNWTVHPH